MTELERMDILRVSNTEANKITRDCLKRAMGRLMSEKPFQKISITELVTVAGVSRPAFYRSYGSKEELLEDISKTIRDTTAEYFMNLRKTSSLLERKTLLTGILNKLQENSQDLIWLTDIGRTILGHEQIETIISAEDSRTRYINAACISALIGIITRWLKTGMKESAEEISDLCCEAYSHILEVE